MMTAIAIGLCLASAVAYAFAALVQRRLAANPITQLGRNPRWWAAIALSTAAAALHVAALRFGPLLLVQPFGLLTLVLAVILGAVEQRRAVTRAERRGLVLACGGLTGLLLLIDTGVDETIDAGQMWALLSIVTIVVLAAMVAGRAARPARAANLWAAGAAGTTFAISSALAQTATVDLDKDGLSAFLDASTFIAVVAVVPLTVVATLLTQVSYRRQFAAALATSTLTNPIVSAAIGVIALGEGVRGGLFGGGLSVATFAIAAWGITELAHQPVASAAAAPAAEPVLAEAESVKAEPIHVAAPEPPAAIPGVDAGRPVTLTVRSASPARTMA